MLNVDFWTTMRDSVYRQEVLVGVTHLFSIQMLDPRVLSLEGSKIVHVLNYISVSPRSQSHKQI